MLVFLKILVLIVCLVGMPGSHVWAGGVPQPPPNAKPDSKLLKRAERLFLHYCAHCHGVKGRGDGYNAEYLDKDPADFSDPEFLSKRSNQKIFRVIQQGGLKVKKSFLMPIFGHTLSEAEIWSLVAYIRHLGQDETHVVIVPEGVAEERPHEPALVTEDIRSFLRWYAKEGKSKAHMDRGELLFRNKKSCFACHRLGDEGGRVGPDLSRAALNYKPEWIYAWARNPQVFNPRSKMPNQGLSSREAGAIAAFLASYEPGMEEEDDEDEASEEKPPFPEEWKEYLDMRGDTKRGQNIFEDPEGKSWCSKCHRVKGEGGMVGPDLSFVGTSRTKSFLMESILNPKAVITTGFSSVMILTHDRKFITGIQKNEDDLALYIVDKEGRDQVILKERIKKFKKQKISMMPGNFKDLLTVQEVADLLAYLGTLTVPEMADAK